MELKVSHLSKAYNNCKALNDVSFSIQAGEVVGLLGHNGAGKSTLIKCMMNAIKSYSGYISIDGNDLRHNQPLLSKECSFLLEPSFCDYLSAKKNLELLTSIIQSKSVQSTDEILSVVSLKKAATKKVGEFSFGMKQRLGLAQIFLSTPHFVILDEPTVGLDPVGIDIIKNTILELSKSGVSVLFSSHQISDIFDVCTRAIVLSAGELVFDDDVNKLLKKRYVIMVDKPIKDRLRFTSISPKIQIENNTLYIDETSVLSQIIDALVTGDYEILDISTENSYDRLKEFLNTGGKQNA